MPIIYHRQASNQTPVLSRNSRQGNNLPAVGLRLTCSSRVASVNDGGVPRLEEAVGEDAEQGHFHRNCVRLGLSKASITMLQKSRGLVTLLGLVAGCCLVSPTQLEELVTENSGVAGQSVADALLP